MTSRPYSQLIRYKQWADRGLYDVVTSSLSQLGPPNAVILLRILDHIHVVDVIFQHHLQRRPHIFKGPQSAEKPDFQRLAEDMRSVDAWYVSYVDNLPESDFDEPVDFVFTNGTPGRMRRSEIVLHVCLHGSYHRGNAGFILQKNGITPNSDRMTDFLETAA